MAIIKYKPTTNGRRNMTTSDFAEITKKKPEKTLLESQSHKAGQIEERRVGKECRL